MRNAEESPLSRASFEESFETFLKAAKFKELNLQLVFQLL